MIIKCEIDVDWVGEDQSVDEVVQRKLVDAVAKKLSEQTIKNIQAEATKELFAQVHDRVEVLLNDFLSKPVIQTDHYGDTKAKYADVTEMLKDKFDNFMDEKVDNHGKVSDSCGYNNKTRIEYFMNSIVRRKAEEATTKMAQDLGRQVDDIIQQMLKDKVTTTLVNKLDIKNLLTKI